jgi:hypothetical protein
MMLLLLCCCGTGCLCSAKQRQPPPPPPPVSLEQLKARLEKRQAATIGQQQQQLGSSRSMSPAAAAEGGGSGAAVPPEDDEDGELIIEAEVRGVGLSLLALAWSPSAVLAGSLPLCVGRLRWEGVYHGFGGTGAAASVVFTAHSGRIQRSWVRTLTEQGHMQEQPSACNTFCDCVRRA